MSLSLWCLVVSAALIYVAKIPLAHAMQQQGGYDNHYPRNQQAQLKGLGARALAAHQNSIEAFPVFAAGVLVAQSANADVALSNILAVAFISARIIYLICYWADWHWQRTLSWFVGISASFLLMLSPVIS